MGSSREPDTATRWTVIEFVGGFRPMGTQE